VTDSAAWMRGDVVLDDTGNMFAFHPIHGWCGLGSNQASARGWYARDGSEGHPYAPLTLLVLDNRAV